MWSFRFIVFIYGFLTTISLSFSHEGHDHEPHPISGGDESDWPQKISMTKLTGVDLRWKPDDPDWVTMEMKAATTGYVSVGFCAPWYGSMRGCDIVVGWVSPNGSAFIRDYHALGNEMPIEDESQDYELLHAVENDRETRITFKRLWTTNDTNDVDLKKNQVRIMYAWHPVDPVWYNQIPPHDRSTRGHTLVSTSLVRKYGSSKGMRLWSFPITLIIPLINTLLKF